MSVSVEEMERKLRQIDALAQQGDEQAKRDAATLAREIRNRRKADSMMANQPEGALGAVRAAVGNASEDLPNVSQAGFGTLKTAAASMFGDDEDYARSLQAEGYTIERDKNGNAIAVSPSGERAYVNQPGLDFEDVTRGVGKVLSFTPAARLANNFAGLLGRTFAGGVGAATTDAGMQVLSGRDSESFDATQTVITGAAGSLAETIAPHIQRGMYWLGSKVGARNATPELGAEILITGGMDESSVRALPEDVLLRVAQQGKVAPDVRPEAQVAEAMGLRPTRAQQTDARQDWRRQERAVETIGSASARRNDQGNMVDALGENLAQSVGGQGQRLPQDAAFDAMDRLRNEATRRRGEVDAAYGAARELGDGGVRPEAFPLLRDRVENWTRSERITGTQARERAYPGAAVAKEDLDAILADFDALTKQGADFRADFGEIEEVRRSLSGAWEAAANPADRRKVKAMQVQFDNWLDEVFDQRLIEGSADFLDSIKDARALNARYKNDFGERWMKNGADRIGRQVERLADGEMSVDEAVEFFVGANQIKTGVAREFARRMKDVMPPEAMNSFKEALVRKLITNANTGEAVASERAILNNLRSALTGKNKSLFEAAFTPNELGRIRAMATGLEGILPGSRSSREAARSSGTTERLIGWMMQQTGDIPFLRIIPQAMERARVGGAAKTGLLRPRNTATEAATAAFPAFTPAWLLADEN